MLSVATPRANVIFLLLLQVKISSSSSSKLIREPECAQSPPLPQKEPCKAGSCSVSPRTVTLLSPSVEETHTGRSAGFSDSLGYTRCCVHSFLPLKTCMHHTPEDLKPVVYVLLFILIKKRHICKEKTLPEVILEVNYDLGDMSDKGNQALPLPDIE